MTIGTPAPLHYQSNQPRLILLSHLRLCPLSPCLPLLAASTLTTLPALSVLGRSLFHNSQLSSPLVTWYPSLVESPIKTPQPHPRNSPSQSQADCETLSLGPRMYMGRPHPHSLLLALPCSDLSCRPSRPHAQQVNARRGFDFQPRGPPR
jgi:hypothetical protein